MSEERPHAKYGFSRLPALDICPGFIGSDESSEYAERGKRIHTALQAVVVGVTAQDSVPEAEDIDAIEYGRSFLKELLGDFPFDDVLIEPRLFTDIPDCSGYADILCLDRLLGEAALIEIKTGFGDRKEAEKNLQLAGQALGVFREYPWVEHINAFLVECDRHQKSMVAYSREDIDSLEEWINSVINRSRRVIQDDLTPSGSCSYCERNEQCPAISGSPERSIVALGDIAILSPKDYAGALSVEDLGARLASVMPIMDLADKYVGALKERAIRIIDAGGDVPGIYVKTMAGARQWEDKEAARSALMKDHPELLELPSPAQAEKVLGAKAVEPYCRKTWRKSLLVGNRQNKG